MAQTGASPNERRTQAERREASERRLLAAAAEVVATQGSTRASFAEIAAVAGQSRSHPHYLFGSKANLLNTLVAEFSTLYREEVVGRIGDTTGLEAIVAVVRLFIRSLHRPLTMTRAFYVLLGESLSTAPEFRDGLNEYHRFLLDLVRGWIEEGVAAGEIRGAVDPGAAAAAIVATVRGIGFLVLSDPGGYDLRALETQVIADLERTLGVVGPDA
jgi:AcrR family transcriptional regulator